MRKSYIIAFLVLITIGISSHCQNRFLLLTDKDFYRRSDDVWFAVHCSHQIDSNQFSTLSIILTYPSVQKIIITSQVLLIDGIGWGRIFLADSLADGTYVLYAYTKQSLKKGLVIRKLINIRNEPVLNAFAFDIEDFTRKQSNSSLTNLIVRTDSSNYHRRSLVKVKISLDEKIAHHDPYGLSVSVIPRQNLQNYNPYYNPYVEDTSIIRLLSCAPLIDSFYIRGYLDCGSKKRKAGTPLIFIGDKILKFYTDENSSFVLPDSILYSANSTNFILFVSDPNQQKSCKLHIKFPEELINEELAKLKVQYTQIANVSINSSGKSDTVFHELPHVIIKAKLKPELDEYMEEYNSRACDRDYVCPVCKPDGVYALLNCPYHLGGNHPLDGQRYMYLANKEGRVGSGRYVVYHCKTKTSPPFAKQLSSISIGPLFPQTNYLYETVEVPQVNTTLYWNPYMVSNDNYEVEFSFYTNDLLGEFIIKIEGGDDSSCLKGQVSFSVL